MEKKKFKVLSKEELANLKGGDGRWVYDSVTKQWYYVEIQG